MMIIKVNNNATYAILAGMYNNNGMTGEALCPYIMKPLSSNFWRNILKWNRKQSQCH